MRSRLLSFAILCALGPAAWAAEGRTVVVDGHMDPAEWTGARHITDFRLTQPLSRAPSPYPTDAWILATPQGLAVAFRNIQPANVPRTHQVAARDAAILAPDSTPPDDMDALAEHAARAPIEGLD